MNETHRLRAAIGSLALVAATLSPIVASAQPPQSIPARRTDRSTANIRDTVRLELTDAIARALGESEEVRLARSQVDLAGAQVTAAKSAALPQIDGNLSYTRTFDSPFNTGTGFTLPDSLKFEPDTTLSLE